MTLLSVENLCVSFKQQASSTQILDRVSFGLKAGKTLGIVGESGCGKSVTALSIMRLLPQPTGTIDSGSILYGKQDLATLPAPAMRSIRGKKIAMIFQDPMTALNPVHTIGKQLGEVYQLHFPDYDKRQRQQKAVELLQQVGISEPEERLKAYPHQLSGGMRQRVMIAMALACKPDILIADEPTTALDVTIQAQILQLIKQLQADTGMAIMFITHDLGVIAEVCDEVAVMYAGRVIEHSSVVNIFARPRHPYTQGLLNSIPRLDATPKTLLHTIPGQVPAIDEMPAGCRFSNRCSYADEQCQNNCPELIDSHKDSIEVADAPPSEQHTVACFHWSRISP